MTQARLCIESDLSAASALARAGVLWDACTAESPVAIYGASLRGEALVLGAYQRSRQAITDAGRGKILLRRASGGVTVRAGDGISYLALCLYERNALMACPRLRILNRNVRGALAGLRLAGLAAHYFGRDFVSVALRPAAYVGWDARPDGRVLVEFFFAERTSFVPDASDTGYPAGAEPAFRGKEPITLGEAGVHAHGTALLEHLAEGCAKTFKLEWNAQPRTLDAGELARSEQRDLRAGAATVLESDELAWSELYEEAIGFVSAGVALDGSGKIKRVQLAGDFFQDSGCSEALERMLCGVSPSSEHVGRSIDAVYLHPSHELEGVRSLPVFAQAILDAASRAAHT